MKKLALFNYYLLITCALAFLSFTICPDAPSNDDPCVNSSNPPIDLTDNGTHNGTTCCATQDLINEACSEVNQVASVWYIFSPDEMDQGYTITINPAGIDPVEGPLVAEVYVGTMDSGCNPESLDSSLFYSCANLNPSFKIGNCFGSDEVLYIKISTSDQEEMCGEFTINIQASSNELTTDKCTDLTNAETLYPETIDAFSLNYVCQMGSLDFACSESDAMGGCSEFTDIPTVWVKVEVDSLAQVMFSTVTTEGDWDPIWSVYSGNGCNDLDLIDYNGSIPCSNEDNTPELNQTSIIRNDESYWISITADPASIPSTGIDVGDFEVCVTTNRNAVLCIGDIENGDCTDQSLTMEVISRDNDHLPLEGPFCPGEEVEIRVSFLYDATPSGADWLIGFVPNFGPGWDMTDYDYDAYPPFGNGQLGQWYAEGSDVAPIIQENIPTLCTYYDEDGTLQLCNRLCSACQECEETGMEEGDPLPGGYFWVSNGGNEGCENDGSPGEGWGIGSVTAQIEWIFKLKVKQFEDLAQCMDREDLTINFQAFSDGVVGCWEDPAGECLLDRAMFSPNWEIGCTELPPGVVAQGQETCSNEMVNIDVSTEDGSSLTIFVRAVDNNFVYGANDHTIENGSGTFSDNLVNLTSEEQIMQYEVFSQDPDLVCYGPKTVIDVVIAPRYILNLEESICICDNGCTTIGVESTEGYTYLWDNGATSSMIEVCPDQPTVYNLSVTDDNGCLITGAVFVDCEGSTEECIDPEYFKLVVDYFIDTDMDGIKDSLDAPINEGLFLLEPDLSLYYNVLSGPDTLLLEEGEYTLTYLNDYSIYFYLTTDSIVTVNLDSINNCVNVDFGIVSNQILRNARVYSHSQHRCNRTQPLTIYARNTGYTVESGILWATIDELALPQGFPGGTEIDTFIAPNRIGWFFEDLYPRQQIVKEILIDVPGPPQVPLNTKLSYKFEMEYNNSDGTRTIFDEIEQIRFLRCSYDPNDKQVEPSHEMGYTDIDQEELVYTVRFQNTGNAPAEDIEIRDTLSEFLDLSSIQYIGGSHDEFLTFTRVENNVLIFNFRNINLPDSTSNLQESQGYLMYSVSPVDDLPEGTIIDNTAHIYFDYNPPIVTNTTRNILYDDVDGDGYFSIEDCDDENLDINPGAEEIPNNDVDEDCDGVALIIDNDGDGYNSDEDCGDENPDINPGADEIINNTVDENCDDLVVIIDHDMDGYNSSEDCDDDNPDINPGAEEIPNNDVDEDCDGEAVIIDNDGDGYNSDEDCDDENADINPGAEEIVNNDVDEDCDGEAVIIDNDGDGYNSDEDCDDENADINPGAEDIPENGIDEDCDGEDAIIINTEDTSFIDVSINPNPSNDAFNIETDLMEELDFVIRDVMGRIIQKGKISPVNKTVFLGEEANGIYLIILSHPEKQSLSIHKLLKI